MLFRSGLAGDGGAGYGVDAVHGQGLADKLIQEGVLAHFAQEPLVVGGIALTELHFGDGAVIIQGDVHVEGTCEALGLHGAALALGGGFFGGSRLLGRSGLSRGEAVDSLDPFNNYYYDLLNLLFSIFDDTNENKNKDEPKNYYSCFGNNNFTVNFNKKDFIFGNFIALIMNFKISNSKILTENPEQLGNCTLININFNDMKKKNKYRIKISIFCYFKRWNKRI